MKQIGSLLLALLLCGLLSACGAPSTSEDSPAQSMSIGSMYNEATGKTISLEMTKESVEALLGAGTEEMLFQPDDDFEPMYEIDQSQYVLYAYGTGEDYLIVSYQEGRVGSLSTYAGFAKTKPSPSNWCTKYGLRYGASLQDIFDQCGETETAPLPPNPKAVEDGTHFVTPNATWKEPVFLSYHLDQDGKPLEGPMDERAYCSFDLVVDEAQDGLMWYGLGL